MDTKKYEKHYSESKLWDKIKKCAKKVGKSAIINVLILYYAMALGKATPSQIAIIIGALGYFISPIDAIPDFIPGGYTDDIALLVATINALSCCSDTEVVRKAREKAAEWFD
ncbi:MAG: YkvA family protein [Bacteroidales bacterium]|nr:YkvA family protein [Bacteroidales bacterium]